MSLRGAPARLLTTAVAGLFAATALVQTGSALTTWDRDVASGLLLSVACVLVGAAIAARRSAPAFGWTLVAIGAVGAASALALAPPASGLLRPIGSWAWLVSPALVPLALLLFPSGRLPSRRWSGALAAALLAPPCLALAGALEDDVWGPAGRAAAALAGVALVCSLAALAARLRHPCELVRRRVLCLALGGLVALLALALDAICLPGARAVGMLALPAAAGVALLRDQLYDLDLTLNRSLVAGGLTLCLLGAYGVSGWIVPAAALPVLAAPALAVGLDPIRRRMQGAVDHALYGRQHDPYAVMTALGRHVDTSEPADGRAALADVAATIAQSLALPYVAIELASDLGGEPAATWGRPASLTVALELCHRGERVGTLRVAPHTIGGTVVADELRLLEDLARQVAVTAHVVQLSRGLQRSREALVTAREEERRRLRRDLHDGLGPTLAAMTLRIDVALRLLAREPAAVAELLTGLRDESRRAIADIRRVAYGLRPPALDELGLIGAIEECTGQFSGAPAQLAVDLDLPEAVPALPAAIEVAALRIVQEALANVAHHSGASACAVRLEVNGAVAIEVCDDGGGLPADYRPGIGLHSMRERAAELGGTCAIEPRRPRGTRVLAELPLAVR